MKQELDEQLCAKYPKIFVDRHADMRTTAMCWGFECGDGWYQILDSLCGQIQHHIDWSHKNHAWDIDYNEKNLDTPRPVREPIPQVVTSQIKEKFGGLRFYYDGGDDYIRGLSVMAESMSMVTCETCGAPGKTRGRGWMYTACDTHAQEGDKE
jgi:hypothetical protein